MNIFPIIRFVIRGESMAPYFPNGKRVLVNRLSYFFRKPKRGDVVIVRDPRDKRRELLKRIVAVSSEKVGETVLRKDEYFIRGDNESSSTDSRVFGPVTKNLIVGKATFPPEADQPQAGTP